jgi:glycosyltransferase involved in cell wall biosynthesis
MKIIHQTFLEEVAGVQTLLTNFLKFSQHKGFEYHVMLYGGLIHPFMDKSIRQSASVHSYKFWNKIKLPKIAALRTWNKSKILKKIDPELIIYWNCLGDKFWKNADSKINARSIYYDHGASWFEPKNSFNKNFVKSMTSVICCSQASKRMMELSWDFKGKIQVVRNPLPVALKRPPSSAKNLSVSKPIKIGIAGRLVPIKGFPIAMHAIKELFKQDIDAELHIAGSGPSQKALIELAHNLNLSKKVHFHGLVKEMPNFYKEIDLFLCASLREPFGLVCIEAMSYGCPVICNCVDGLPEVVSHMKTGLCISPTLPLKDYLALGGATNKIPPLIYDPYTDSLKEPMVLSPYELAKSISQLCCDTKLYQKMSRACLSEVDKFSFRQYAERLEQIFRE